MAAVRQVAKVERLVRSPCRTPLFASDLRDNPQSFREFQTSDKDSHLLRMAAYNFDVSAPTQAIIINPTTGIQFWNVIPNTVESSVKNCRYVLIQKSVLAFASKNLIFYCRYFR